MKCRLIFHNILHNRKKAVRAIISICFSVMLIFSSINAYISFQDMRLQNAYQTNGEYNITLHNVTSNVPPPMSHTNKLPLKSRLNNDL